MCSLLKINMINCNLFSIQYQFWDNVISRYGIRYVIHVLSIICSNLSCEQNVKWLYANSWLIQANIISRACVAFLKLLFISLHMFFHDDIVISEVRHNMHLMNLTVDDFSTNLLFYIGKYYSNIWKNISLSRDFITYIEM